MKHKKLLTAGICLILAGILLITGASAVRNKYINASGETVSQVVNRVNISVSATEFVFRNADKNGMLECRTTVSIGKTEPDFYGMLHSITISGCETGYVMYTAGKDNGDAVLPEETVLPVRDGTAIPLEWEVTFTVPFEEGKTEYTASLDINYSTGVKPNLKQRYMTSIPVTITMEK